MASNVPLTKSLSLRSDILNRFWHINNVFDEEKYGLYFKYYDDVCHKLSTSSEIFAMSARTHEDVFHVMDALWKSTNKQTLTRRQIRQTLQNSTQPSLDQSAKDNSRINSPEPLPSLSDDFQDDSSAEQQTSMINNTINLALRLWLTMDIRARQFGGVGDVQWDDDCSLRKFIDQEFPKGKKEMGMPHSRDVVLDEEFTAPNLFRRRGIKTEFTYKLTHHLLYDSKAQSLMVYPLRHCLNLHKMCKSAILPEQLIDETIKSLGILFPQDSQTETFMKQFHFRGRFGHDYPFPLPGSTRLSEFDYWQDRLAEIYFILKGPPTTWRQKFHEDLAGWFSFWGVAVAITVMTFIFGSISVALAFWSVVIAQQSLEVAQEGLTLARQAATSAANTVTSSTGTNYDVPMSTTLLELVKQI